MHTFSANSPCRLATIMTAVMFASSATTLMTNSAHAATQEPDTVRSTVETTISPVMKQYGIPGMAIGIVDGDKEYFFDFGVSSRESGKPVNRSTLFELGSISKTFTATLASYGQEKGQLKLSDPVSRYLPEMKGPAFGEVKLLHLGTHTPGGFPLQVPDDIRNTQELMTYLQHWKPQFSMGTQRTYSNPSIGMLGFITAKAMGQEFTPLIQTQLFSGLGLQDTYIDVPSAKMKDYAQGYTKQDKPTRVNKAVLWAEAYGVKSTSRDMLRFLQSNMQMGKIDDKLQRAVINTHQGYFQTSAFTQDLIWEQYPYPVPVESLLKGNSSAFALSPQAVTPVHPPQPPQNKVWINKTGSTNGFGAYVAFVPDRKLGIVILANKNYPNEDRIRIAHKILSHLQVR